MSFRPRRINCLPNRCLKGFNPLIFIIFCAMTLIKTFREISQADTAIAGGKDASLVQNKKHNYYFSWGERHSIISTESWLRGYVTLKNIVANDNRNVFILVKNGSVQTYNTEEDLPIAHKSGEKILNNH